MARRLDAGLEIQHRDAARSAALPMQVLFAWPVRSWLVLLQAAIVVVLLMGCQEEPPPVPRYITETSYLAPEAAATTVAIAPEAVAGTSTPAAGTATGTPALTQATSPITPTPTPTQTPFEEINFTGVITLTNLPSQVQVVFSLRDEEGHAIVLSSDEIDEAARVYEREQGEIEWGDWEEIDYTETSFFVHTAENFRLEVVFVLDFTNSMAQATLPDGRSGIDAMVAAFESAVLALPGAHRIGVVEFHDRNVEPSVLSPLTISRESVLASVRQFSQSGFDHGSSRVWDSLVAGSDLLSGDDDIVRALVFLSDGRDTSSENGREDAAWYAAGRKVQLYALGVGEIYEEAGLRDAALQTGGSYYRAQQVAGLEDQLKILVDDLRGQYKISYITLRRTGMYQARINLELRGAEGTFETEWFDVARFYGPDDRGVAQSDPASIDRALGQATLFMRAMHVPRNIDRVRFKLETSKPVTVEAVSGEDGGLVDGWTLSGPDAEGYYESSSGEPIEFGNFGPLFRLTVSDVTEERLSIPVSFDNSIYAGEKGFSHPLPITVGQHLWMYWADVYSGKIQRAKLDGSGVEDVVTRQPQPYGIALDSSSGKIYWADVKTGNIQRANLDGSEVEHLILGLDRPFGVALDVDAGKMYWTTGGIAIEVGRVGEWWFEVLEGPTGGIQRANLDGSRVEDLVIAGAIAGEWPGNIALDVVGNKMYWADAGKETIRRANLDGSEIEDLVTEGEWLDLVALDVAGGKMYWADRALGKIQRANLDGSEIEDLVTGLDFPSALALDVAAGGMYWADLGTSKVQRASLDGSGVIDIATGSAVPIGIALELD